MLKDQNSNIIDTSKLYWRVACFYANESVSIADTITLPNDGGSFYIKSGFRAIISLRLLKSGSQQNEIDVRFWFVLGPTFSSSLTEKTSEPKMDPILLDSDARVLKTSRKSKKSSVVTEVMHKCKMIFRCELVSTIPHDLFNVQNPMSISLPTKRQLFLSDFLLDFNGINNDIEKRLTIGEHNGEKWVNAPISVILQPVKGNISGSSVMNTIILRSDSEIELIGYLKLRIEVSEVKWTANLTAQKCLIFSGYILIHSKKKLGDRTVILTGRQSGLTDATFKLRIKTLKEKEKESNAKNNNAIKMKEVKYQSEVLKILGSGACADQRLISRKLPEKNEYISSCSQFVTVEITIRGIKTSTKLHQPESIIMEIFGTKQKRIKIRFESNQDSEYIKAEKSKQYVEIEVPKNDFHKKCIPIRLINSPSGWLNSSCVFRLKDIDMNERFEVELPTVPHYEYSEIYPIENIVLMINVKKCKRVLNSGQLTRDESKFLLPMTKMSSIRGWVNSDPAMIGKIKKLHASKVLQLSEAALSEEIRLMKKESFSINTIEKSYQIDKEMVIYSTLIGAATESIEIIGTAGKLSEREIKIENLQDHAIKLYIDRPGDKLFFPHQNCLSVAENGQYIIEVGALEEKKILITFFPILPNDSFDSVIDVTTKKGNVFKVSQT